MRVAFFTTILLCFTFFANAQKVGLNLNVQALNIDFANDVDNNQISLNDYDGSISFSGNLKFFTKKLWAYRVGAGWQNIEYSIGNGDFSTNYKAERNNFTAYLGLEKHFDLKLFDVYPGVYIPLTYVGDDKLIGEASQFYDSVKNGDLHAGFGLLLGVNIKLLKVLRLGLEFNTEYEQFKQDVSDTISSDDGFKIKNFGFATDFVIGIAF